MSEKIEQEAWDEMAEAWGEMRKAGFARGPTDFIMFYMSHALARKDKRILVIGLSTGEIIQVLRRVGSKSQIMAFDLSERSVRLTGEKAKSEELAVSLAKASALHVPFKDAGFDQVIITDFLLDNLGGEDPAVTAISEAFRVLKKGGSFITVTSNFTFSIIPAIVGLMVNSLGLAMLPRVWEGARAMFGRAMDANARGDSATALVIGTASAGMVCAPAVLVSYLARRAAGVSVKGKLIDYSHPTAASSVYFLSCLFLSMKKFDGSLKEQWARAAKFSKCHRMQQRNHTAYQERFLRGIIGKAGGENIIFGKLSEEMLGQFIALGISAAKK